VVPLSDIAGAVRGGLLSNDLTHLYNELQDEVHNFVVKNNCKTVARQYRVALCILTLRSHSLPSLCNRRYINGHTCSSVHYITV
jgi:hypothetical protein